MVFIKTSLTLVKARIGNAKEKILLTIRRKVIERDLKSQIEIFPNIKKESLMDDISPYKNFIDQINKFYNYIIENKNILNEMNKDYVLEIKTFLEKIKEKLDYVIEQHNPNNTDHLKFSFPANRLSPLITGLIDNLNFIQFYTQS